MYNPHHQPPYEHNQHFILLCNDLPFIEINKEYINYIENLDNKTKNIFPYNNSIFELFDINNDEQFYNDYSIKIEPKPEPEQLPAQFAKEPYLQRIYVKPFTSTFLEQ